MISSSGDKTIVFISDIHFGHPRIPAALCLKHLHTHLYSVLNDDVDLLCIGGDVFDQIVTLDKPAVVPITMFMMELQELALKHKFYIRIVQGTFKHDRHQVQLLTTTAWNKKILLHNAPLIKIGSSLEIEILPYINISIGYMPDDLTQNVDKRFRKLLRTHQLKQVDILLRHGYCTHLLPIGLQNTPVNTFSAAELSKLAKLTLNGHVHTPSVYKQVISGGSFERLAFNEEEAKGFFIITYKSESAFTYKFIENTDAVPMVTLRTSSKDPIKIHKRLKNLVKRYDTQAMIFVQLILKNYDLRDNILGLIKNFPKRVHIYVRPDKGNSEVIPIEFQVVDLPEITPVNLPQHILAYLEKHGTSNNITLPDIKSVLEQLT